MTNKKEVQAGNNKVVKKISRRRLRKNKKKTRKNLEGGMQAALGVASNLSSLYSQFSGPGNTQTQQQQNSFNYLNPMDYARKGAGMLINNIPGKDALKRGICGEVEKKEAVGLVLNNHIVKTLAAAGGWAVNNPRTIQILSTVTKDLLNDPNLKTNIQQISDKVSETLNSQARNAGSLVTEGLINAGEKGGQAAAKATASFQDYLNKLNDEYDTDNYNIQLDKTILGRYGLNINKAYQGLSGYEREMDPHLKIMEKDLISSGYQKFADLQWRSEIADIETKVNKPYYDEEEDSEIKRKIWEKMTVAFANKTAQLALQSFEISFKNDLVFSNDPCDLVYFKHLGQSLSLAQYNMFTVAKQSSNKDISDMMNLPFKVFIYKCWFLCCLHCNYNPYLNDDKDAKLNLKSNTYALVPEYLMNNLGYFEDFTDIIQSKGLDKDVEDLIKKISYVFPLKDQGINTGDYVNPLKLIPAALSDFRNKVFDSNKGSKLFGNATKRVTTANMATMKVCFKVSQLVVEKYMNGKEDLNNWDRLTTVIYALKVIIYITLFVFWRVDLNKDTMSFGTSEWVKVIKTKSNKIDVNDVIQISNYVILFNKLKKALEMEGISSDNQKKTSQSGGANLMDKYNDFSKKDSKKQLKLNVVGFLRSTDWTDNSNITGKHVRKCLFKFVKNPSIYITESEIQDEIGEANIKKMKEEPNNNALTPRQLYKMYMMDLIKKKDDNIYPETEKFSFNHSPDQPETLDKLIDLLSLSNKESPPEHQIHEKLVQLKKFFTPLKKSDYGKVTEVQEKVQKLNDFIQKINEEKSKYLPPVENGEHYIRLSDLIEEEKKTIPMSENYLEYLQTLGTDQDLNIFEGKLLSCLGAFKDSETNKNDDSINASDDELQKLYQDKFVDLVTNPSDFFKKILTSSGIRGGELEKVVPENLLTRFRGATDVEIQRKSIIDILKHILNGLPMLQATGRKDEADTIKDTAKFLLMAQYLKGLGKKSIIDQNSKLQEILGTKASKDNEYGDVVNQDFKHCLNKTLIASIIFGTKLQVYKGKDLKDLEPVFYKISNEDFYKHPCSMNGQALYGNWIIELQDLLDELEDKREKLEGDLLEKLDTLKAKMNNVMSEPEIIAILNQLEVINSSESGKPSQGGRNTSMKKRRKLVGGGSKNILDDGYVNNDFKVDDIVFDNAADSKKYKITKIGSDEDVGGNWEITTGNNTWTTSVAHSLKLRDAIEFFTTELKNDASDFTKGKAYYVSEVVDDNHVKLSETKDGSGKTSGSDWSSAQAKRLYQWQEEGNSETTAILRSKPMLNIKIGTPVHYLPELYESVITGIGEPEPKLYQYEYTANCDHTIGAVPNTHNIQKSLAKAVNIENITAEVEGKKWSYNNSDGSATGDNKIGIKKTITFTVTWDGEVKIDDTASAPKLKLSNGGVATYNNTYGDSPTHKFTYTTKFGEGIDKLTIVSCTGEFKKDGYDVQQIYTDDFEGTTGNTLGVMYSVINPQYLIKKDDYDQEKLKTMLQTKFLYGDKITSAVVTGGFQVQDKGGRTSEHLNETQRQKIKSPYFKDGSGTGKWELMIDGRKDPNNGSDIATGIELENIDSDFLPEFLTRWFCDVDKQKEMKIAYLKACLSYLRENQLRDHKPEKIPFCALKRIQKIISIKLPKLEDKSDKELSFLEDRIKNENFSFADQPPDKYYHQISSIDQKISGIDQYLNTQLSTRCIELPPVGKYNDFETDYNQQKTLTLKHFTFEGQQHKIGNANYNVGTIVFPLGVSIHKKSNPSITGYIKSLQLNDDKTKFSYVLNGGQEIPIEDVVLATQKQPESEEHSIAPMTVKTTTGIQDMLTKHLSEKDRNIPDYLLGDGEFGSIQSEDGDSTMASKFLNTLSSGTNFVPLSSQKLNRLEEIKEKYKTVSTHKAEINLNSRFNELDQASTVEEKAKKIAELIPSVSEEILEQSSKDLDEQVQKKQDEIKSENDTAKLETNYESIRNILKGQLEHRVDGDIETETLDKYICIVLSTQTSNNLKDMLSRASDTIVDKSTQLLTGGIAVIKGGIEGVKKGIRWFFGGGDPLKIPLSEFNEIVESRFKSNDNANVLNNNIQELYLKIMAHLESNSESYKKSPSYIKTKVEDQKKIDTQFQDDTFKMNLLVYQIMYAFDHQLSMADAYEISWVQYFTETNTGKGIVISVVLTGAALILWNVLSNRGKQGGGGEQIGGVLTSEEEKNFALKADKCQFLISILESINECRQICRQRKNIAVSKLQTITEDNTCLFFVKVCPTGEDKELTFEYQFGRIKNEIMKIPEFGNHGKFIDKCIEVKLKQVSLALVDTLNNSEYVCLTKYHFEDIIALLKRQSGTFLSNSNPNDFYDQQLSDSMTQMGQSCQAIISKEETIQTIKGAAAKIGILAGAAVSTYATYSGIAMAVGALTSWPAVIIAGIGGKVYGETLWKFLKDTNQSISGFMTNAASTATSIATNPKTQAAVLLGFIYKDKIISTVKPAVSKYLGKFLQNIPLYKKAKRIYKNHCKQNGSDVDKISPDILDMLINDCDDGDEECEKRITRQAELLQKFGLGNAAYEGSHIEKKKIGDDELLLLLIYSIKKNKKKDIENEECTIDHEKQEITIGQDNDEDKQSDLYTQYAILKLLYEGDNSELYTAFKDNLLSELSIQGRKIFEAYKNAVNKELIDNFQILMKPTDNETAEKKKIQHFFTSMVDQGTSKKELSDLLKIILVPVKVLTINLESSQELYSDPFKVTLSFKQLPSFINPRKLYSPFNLIPKPSVVSIQEDYQEILGSMSDFVDIYSSQSEYNNKTIQEFEEHYDNMKRAYVAYYQRLSGKKEDTDTDNLLGTSNRKDMIINSLKGLMSVRTVYKYLYEVITTMEAPSIYTSVRNSFVSNGSGGNYIPKKKRNKKMIGGDPPQFTSDNVKKSVKKYIKEQFGESSMRDKNLPYDSDTYEKIEKEFMKTLDDGKLTIIKNSFNVPSDTAQKDQAVGIFDTILRQLKVLVESNIVVTERKLRETQQTIKDYKYDNIKANYGDVQYPDAIEIDPEIMPGFYQDNNFEQEDESSNWLSTSMNKLKRLSYSSMDTRLPQLIYDKPSVLDRTRNISSKLITSHALEIGQTSNIVCSMVFMSAENQVIDYNNELDQRLNQQNEQSNYDSNNANYLQYGNSRGFRNYENELWRQGSNVVKKSGDFMGSFASSAIQAVGEVSGFRGIANALTSKSIGISKSLDALSDARRSKRFFPLLAAVVCEIERVSENEYLVRIVNTENEMYFADFSQNYVKPVFKIQVIGNKCIYQYYTTLLNNSNPYLKDEQYGHTAYYIGDRERWLPYEDASYNDVGIQKCEILFYPLTPTKLFAKTYNSDFNPFFWNMCMEQMITSYEKSYLSKQDQIIQKLFSRKIEGVDPHVINSSLKKSYDKIFDHDSNYTNKFSFIHYVSQQILESAYTENKKELSKTIRDMIIQFYNINSDYKYSQSGITEEDINNKFEILIGYSSSSRDKIMRRVGELKKKRDDLRSNIMWGNIWKRVRNGDFRKNRSKYLKEIKKSGVMSYSKENIVKAEESELKTKQKEAYTNEKRNDTKLNLADEKPKTLNYYSDGDRPLQTPYKLLFKPKLQEELTETIRNVIGSNNISSTDIKRELGEWIGPFESIYDSVSKGDIEKNKEMQDFVEEIQRLDKEILDILRTHEHELMRTQVEKIYFFKKDTFVEIILTQEQSRQIYLGGGGQQGGASIFNSIKGYLFSGDKKKTDKKIREQKFDQELLEKKKITRSVVDIIKLDKNYQTDFKRLSKGDDNTFEITIRSVDKGVIYNSTESIRKITDSFRILNIQNEFDPVEREKKIKKWETQFKLLNTEPKKHELLYLLQSISKDEYKNERTYEERFKRRFLGSTGKKKGTSPLAN